MEDSDYDPAIRLLWPELAPEAADRVDHESALIAERRAKTFRAYTTGAPMRRIAEQVGTSPATVCRDVHHVLDGYRLIALQEAAAHLASMLARLATIESELWTAWERSRGEAVEMSTSRRAGVDKATDEARVRRKQRDGDPRWMKLILGCVDRRCKLLGLLRPDADPAKAPPAPLVVGGEADPDAL